MWVGTPWPWAPIASSRSRSRPPPWSSWSAPCSVTRKQKGPRSYAPDRDFPVGRASAAESTPAASPQRSEEHTSELQSQSNLVCRLLLEKKKKRYLESKGPAWRNRKRHG